MSSYNRNSRGYDFEPGSDRPPASQPVSTGTNREEVISFDDDFDDLITSSPRRRAPEARRSPERRDPRQEDAFDNYRPGTMLGVTDERNRQNTPPEPPARRRSARVNENFEARFEDDFDDDIAPRRQAAPPSIHDYRPPRRGYGRANNYGENYDEEQFRSEFGGIKGLGVRRRELSEQEEADRRRQARRERELIESDGYRGGREMMIDQAYDGSVGVPKLFADYFRNDYEPPRRVIINGGSTSYVRRRANKAIGTAVAAVLVLAVLVGGLILVSVNRVTTPLNVSTALSSMDTNTSMQLIKNTVDETLAAKSIPVSYTGSSGQSGSGTFYLSDCDFEYTTNEDGTVEYVEVTDSNGVTSNHTLRTRGSIRYDETKVINYLNELVGTDGTPMIEPKHEVRINLDPETWQYSAELEVTAGVDGFGIDYDAFIGKAMNCINTGVYAPISADLQITYTPDIDIASIHEQVYTEAADAFSVTDGMGQVTYTEHVIGLDFDTTNLQNIISSGNETSWTMDLNLTMPKTTLQELRKDQCPDLLATYYTEFNAGNVGRTSNIEKCCEYINNYYLTSPMQPGDVFSFNEIVGQRTAERGFSKATVYSSEGTDEDYGGGICQVSSTLYYTTILANLEIVERRNHMYTVGYMTRSVADSETGKRFQTFANDATVNWGTCDFKFSNSKQYPIRIELIVSGGTLTCNIWGTWDGFTADFGYDEIDTEPYSIIYHRANPDKSNQAGQLGRTIDSYRIVYYNGEEYDRFHEAESTYLPLMQVKYTNDLPAGREYDVVY